MCNPPTEEEEMVTIKTTEEIHDYCRYYNRNNKWALIKELIPRLEVAYGNNNPEILLRLIKELKKVKE